jgi:DNA invertase Pin-like site-specific DNA recombinase
MKMPDRIWNAAEYTRLSRDDGDKAESNSITSQKEIIRDYVRQHPEFVIVKEYADDGYSGVNFERPGFKQMMEDIKAKKIDCVICKDLSRFARNYIDAGRYLEKIFPFMGVRFIAINDSYDSCGEKAQSDALIVPFKNLINDAYCRDISVKIRSQLDIKRKMGDFIGAFAPYGYRKDETNRNKLVVDEEAARTVELIFSLRIQGLCNSAIADRLNSMGILSPMEYKQAQGLNYSCGFRSNEQAQWSPMLVKRILSNEIYIGTLIQHKSGTPNHKIKKRVEYDRDEWIVIEESHEPIICRSDFETVQNLMLRDVRTAPKQEKVHLFSGFVFCGDCKRTMVRKTVPSGGRKYHYLVCSTNKAGKGCSPHTFSEDKLKAIVFRVVNDHIELIAQVEQVLDYIASLPEQERRIINYDAQLTALENEIKRYQDLKINLYSDMADGVISREEYREFHAGYDRRIADRQRQLGKLKDERSQALENSSGNIEWIEQFKKYRHLTELDRECIVHLIEKILIYDGKRIEVCFRYKDELENALQYIERFEDVLPAEDGVTMPERRNA